MNKLMSRNKKTLTYRLQFEWKHDYNKIIIWKGFVEKKSYHERVCQYERLYVCIILTNRTINVDLSETSIFIYTTNRRCHRVDYGRLTWHEPTNKCSHDWATSLKIWRKRSHYTDSTDYEFTGIDLHWTIWSSENQYDEKNIEIERYHIFDFRS